MTQIIRKVDGDAIKHRRLETWLQTIGGFALLGAFMWIAFWATGFSFRFQAGFWLLYPLIGVLSWMFSDKISLYITKSVPLDRESAEGKRIYPIVERLMPKTGLSHTPPVFFAPNPLPNAFATGPFPARAVIAITAGLLDPEMGMTDDEIEGVLAHELAHVKNGDVGINSLFGVFSTLFFQIFAAVVDGWVSMIKVIKRPVGLENKKLLPAIVGTIISNAIFYVAQQLMRIVQLFVVRSRESGADALGAQFTQNPCALATGLLKLAKFVETHRPQTQREKALWASLNHAIIINPMFDSTTVEEQPKDGGFIAKLKKLWTELHYDHPPIPDRVVELEKMNGGACPRPAGL